MKHVLGIIAFSLAVVAASVILSFTIPLTQTPVSGFKVEKYLGKWHEIARMDFRSEKHLTQVSAEYSLRDDGTVRVLNRGYDTLAKKWKEAEGKAKFDGPRDRGKLKVSFFGPFYSDYKVVKLDDQYRYALVLGKSPRYMWILSREKTIPDDIRRSYLEEADKLGVKTGELVWTPQAESAD